MPRSHMRFRPYESANHPDAGCSAHDMIIGQSVTHMTTSSVLWKYSARYGRASVSTVNDAFIPKLAAWMVNRISHALALSFTTSALSFTGMNAFTTRADCFAG
eukprot:7386840-Prymnesium_polylepis.1